ncbi:hypothetical protein PoB_005722600 [Plakobranchus ocellatus]|uniref:Uncharacterized protein n=1 Tax=Plakobranchus ocellatus TaxID=259542 RepID=A0AAV4CH43_9GAST|nr:hypothetical protein PoB_005722600 [Plakobranchus ocellatus]
MILLGYRLIMLAVFNGTQPLQSSPNSPALEAMARAPHSNLFAAARGAFSIDRHFSGRSPPFFSRSLLGALFFISVRPQRIKREAKALNILNVIGEVREGLRQPEAITHTSFAKSMTRRPAFCSAFLEKPEGLRQCKMKPLRDSNLCRHHDPRFCTAATRRKLDHATAVREYMKAQVQEGRRQEREAERDARRWGSQEVTVDMSDEEIFTIRNNQVDFTPFIDPVKKVGEAAAQETRAWLEERQRNTSQANKEVLCRPSFVKQLDAVVTNFRVRKETRTEDPRDRQYDYGAITATHEGKMHWRSKSIVSNESLYLTSITAPHVAASHKLQRLS